jgi:hypothetical protein
VQKYLNAGNIMPDLAIDLGNILVPIACQSFELLGIEVAKQIAHEYGANVTLMHNGKRDLDRYAKTFDNFPLKLTKKRTENPDTAEAIIDEATSGNYQLLIMPSRRRAKWIDKFFINSISAKVIPEVDFDVLQVFPAKEKIPGDNMTIPDFDRIAIMLSRTQRDPRLLFWGNSLLQKEHSSLIAFHIADLPRLTPMKVALDTQVVIKENDDFQTMARAYESIFSTDIDAKFLVSHKTALTASNFLNREKPDIAVMGQSKLSHWWQIRTLSDKILDAADVPFIIHHYPNSKSG